MNGRFLVYIAILCITGSTVSAITDSPTATVVAIGGATLASTWIAATMGKERKQ